MSPATPHRNVRVIDDEAEPGVDLEAPSLALESHIPHASLCYNDTGRASERINTNQSCLKYASRFFIHSTATLLKFGRQHREHDGRPHLCKESSCKHRQFADKAGLQRHSREAHGSEAHCCPITSCTRHRKGFPRKYNLLKHQKRCHPDPVVHSTRQYKETQSNAIERAKHDSGPTSTQEWSHNEFGSGLGKERESRRGEDPVGEDKLKRKIQDLKKSRAEMYCDIDDIEQDIGTLERALSMMTENSA